VIVYSSNPAESNIAPGPATAGSARPQARGAKSEG
jgi:hypothetical protein